MNAAEAAAATTDSTANRTVNSAGLWLYSRQETGRCQELVSLAWPPRDVCSSCSSSNRGHLFYYWPSNVSKNLNVKWADEHTYEQKEAPSLFLTDTWSTVFEMFRKLWTCTEIRVPNHHRYHHHHLITSQQCYTHSNWMTACECMFVSGCLHAKEKRPSFLHLPPPLLHLHLLQRIYIKHLYF